MKKPITVYSTTKITNFMRLAWFKITLENFLQCTSEEKHLYNFIVIDDSPPPFSQRLVTLCQDCGVELIRDFSNSNHVFYAGVWKYILESCLSPLLLFLPDDIWSIQKQNYLGPSIKAFEQHSDLYQIDFQSVFSAWRKGIGHPNYHANRFYEIHNSFVETVHATRLYPYPIDEENTLWKTSLNEYRGIGECCALNHTLLRVDVMRQYIMPSPRWISPRLHGKRLFRWWYRLRKSALAVSPAEVEFFLSRRTDIDRRFNSGYLNMQAFSYTPDHQPCEIDDIEAFKQVNSIKLISL